MRSCAIRIMGKAPRQARQGQSGLTVPSDVIQQQKIVNVLDIMLML